MKYLSFKFNLYELLNKSSMLLFLIYMIAYNIFSYRKDTVILSEGILIILLLSISMYIFKVKKSIKIGTLGLFYFITLIYLICSMYWSIDENISFAKIKTLVLLMIFSMFLYNYFDSKKKIDIAVKFINISYVFLGIYTINKYGLLNFFSGSINERIGSDISQINVLGMSLAMGAILSFYYAFYKKNKFYYVFFIFLFIVSAFTESRKAFLIVIIGVILLVFMKNRVKHIFKTVILLILIFIVMKYIISLPIFDGVIERFSGIFDSSKSLDASANIRSNMIEDGIQFFLQRPFIGYGYDCFRVLAYGTYSHNNYIEMLINGGIIGFTIYYIPYLYLIINFFKKICKHDDISILFFILLIIQLIMDFAQVSYYSKLIYINFAIYFAYIDLDKNSLRRIKLHD